METWVKGGYFQIDKVGFMKIELLDKIWKNPDLKDRPHGDQLW